MSFEQRRVLMTGGTGGLGALIARDLRGQGAQVTVVSRAPPEGAPGYLRHDLSTVSGIDAAAAAVAGSPWDLLINLAGRQYFGPMEDQPAQDVLAAYLLNLVAPVRLAQAVLPRMKAARAGQIVNVGSIFGSINFGHFVSYSSAKAGLRGFSQALRRELAGTGVGVTYIAPRGVRTGFNSGEVAQFAHLTGMAMDEPQPVARRIVDAIGARRHEVFLGMPEALFVPLNALFPSVVDLALAANDRKAAAWFSRGGLRPTGGLGAAAGRVP